MIQGTPIYSTPFDLEGSRSFKMLVHRTRGPFAFGRFVAIHVETTDDEKDKKRSWVGMEKPIRLDAGDAVWATFVNAKRYVRYFMEVPEGTDGTGITIEIVKEP